MDFVDRIMSDLFVFHVRLILLRALVIRVNLALNTVMGLSKLSVALVYLNLTDIF